MKNLRTFYILILIFSVLGLSCKKRTEPSSTLTTEAVRTSSIQGIESALTADPRIPLIFILTDTETATATSNGLHLDAGQDAGIGVGVGVGALMGLGGIVAMVVSRRRAPNLEEDLAHVKELPTDETRLLSRDSADASKLASGKTVAEGGLGRVESRPGSVGSPIGPDRGPVGAVITDPLSRPNVRIFSRGEDVGKGARADQDALVLTSSKDEAHVKKSLSDPEHDVSVGHSGETVIVEAKAKVGPTTAAMDHIDDGDRAEIKRMFDVHFNTHGMPPEGITRIPPYDVEVRTLGAGSYGTVSEYTFRMTPPATGPPVKFAVKQFNGKDAVTREAADNAHNVAMELAHDGHFPKSYGVHTLPNGQIVSFTELGEVVDMKLEPMLKLVDNRNFQDPGKFAATNGVAPTEFVDFGRDSLEGLKALHDHNMIHGDLKAPNMIRGFDGKFKIIDLDGVVKGKECPQTSTSGYAAPEFEQYKDYIAKKKLNNTSPAEDEKWKDYDPRSLDVYSTGALLVEQRIGLMAQELGKGFTDAASHLRDIFSKEPYSKIPKEEQDLYLKMLEPDPAKRISAPEALAAYNKLFPVPKK